MDFSRIVEVYERLEETSSRLDMISIVAGFLKEIPEEDMPQIILFLMGRIFPAWSEKELGVGNKLIIKAISKVTGVTEKKIEEKIKETGDTGLATESLIVKKAQMTLYSEKLTIKRLQHNLEKLTELTGKGSQDKKLAYIEEMLSSAEPTEARYIIRLILGELRLGVGEGIIKEAIASAFSVDPKLVERAYSLSTDLGEVAQTAKASGNEGLKRINLRVGRPIEVMLAQKAENINEALEKLGKAAFEIKYDGARIQIHKQGNKIELFTRRLENVTRQFPEIVNAAVNNIKAESAIIEGELVAIRSKGDRRPQPFQNLSKRIKRKYDIDEMTEKIPVEINLFDVIALESESKLELSFMQRRHLLEEIINKTDDFRIAEQIITDKVTEAEEFYKKAIDSGHEGVMAKNLSAPYQPGSRVGYMYKIKPVMETLDLVIVGATWGEGRRAHWLGSYLLALYDPESGDFLTIGRMATGFSDEQLEEMTQLLKDDIIREDGKEAILKPKVVVEVAYEEIQKSPTYTSGYALRFPRLVRFRPDKGPEDADTPERVESLFKISKT